MDKVSGVPVHGEMVVEEFIHMLTIQAKLTPKTLREYASDLKHFLEWCKANTAFGEKDIRIDNMDLSTLKSYRDYSQNVLQLKPATINRRLITLKRLFKWAAAESKISSDPSKPLKFIPEDKVSPRRMTAREEAAFLSAVEQKFPAGSDHLDLDVSYGAADDGGMQSGANRYRTGQAKRAAYSAGR